MVAELRWLPGTPEFRFASSTLRTYGPQGAAHGAAAGHALAVLPATMCIEKSLSVITFHCNQIRLMSLPVTRNNR